MIEVRILKKVNLQLGLCKGYILCTFVPSSGDEYPDSLSDTLILSVCIESIDISCKFACTATRIGDKDLNERFASL